MADNFDLKKFIIESKLNIKVPVKETDKVKEARQAKVAFKLNSSSPDVKARVKNPSNYSDKKQFIINCFIDQAKEKGDNVMKVELQKSFIEKYVAEKSGTQSYSMTPEVKTQLLQPTVTVPKPSEREPEEGDMLGDFDDAEDMVIGKKSLRTKKAKPEVEPEEEPPAKVLSKAPKATDYGMRAGEWLLANSDLIDKIIKQYSQSTIRTGKLQESEPGSLSKADFTAAQTKSKEAAKVALPASVEKLVSKLEELRDEDYKAYTKVLNDLDKYKFGATNTKGVMKMILKALGEDSIPAIGTKRKTSDEDELKKLGIDDEPINIDGEEEL